MTNNTEVVRLKSNHELSHASSNSINTINDDHAKTLTTPHILLVDDNEELREFLHGSLISQYQITEASDGVAGLAKAKEEFPDLIISDLMMPNMDGIEFCRLVKEDIENSHIPFLMLTAKDALGVKNRRYGVGCRFLFFQTFKHKSSIANTG